MHDLNEFKVNFPAGNHDLPAVVAREFSDAMNAAQSVKMAKAGPIRLFCHTVFRTFPQAARPASWLNFSRTLFARL